MEGSTTDISMGQTKSEPAQWQEIAPNGCHWLLLAGSLQRQQGSQAKDSCQPTFQFRLVLCPNSNAGLIVTRPGSGRPGCQWQQCQ